MSIDPQPGNRSARSGAPAGARPRPAFAQNFLKTWVAAHVVKIGYISAYFSVPFYEEIERELGLGRAEFMVMQCLHHTPGLTATDIKSLTKQPKNSISWAIHRLVGHGLISRVSDLDDGRRAVLQLSPAGARICDRVVPMIGARQKALLACLTRAERQSLEAILDKLVVHVADLPTLSLAGPLNGLSGTKRAMHRQARKSTSKAAGKAATTKNG